MVSENVKKIIRYFIYKSEYELLENFENALTETFLEGINAMRDIEEKYALYKKEFAYEIKASNVIDLPKLVTEITKEKK